MRTAVEGQGGNRDGLAPEVQRYARTLEATNLALGRIARDLAADLRRDSGEASTYGVALADFAAELAGRDALAPLASLAEAGRAATEAMHLRLQALEARIALGAAETEELRERLVEAKREAGTDPLTGAGSRRCWRRRRRGRTAPRSACCCSTSTASRASTTSTATKWVTRRCG